MIKGLFKYMIFSPLIFVLLNNVTKIESHLIDVESMQFVKAEPIATLIIEEPAEPEETHFKSLGIFECTGYCPCEKCCGKWGANRGGAVVGSCGIELIEGAAIAVDPDVIAYHTRVIINGNEYIALDCGGAIKGNKIDIYFENHEDALNFGVQYMEVFIYEEDEI